MDEWEALWATERAAVVKRIKDNKWGKSADGKTVTGPEGYTLDLTKCPAGWSDTEGLTDTEIKFGHTLPNSGPAADYGNVGKSMGAIFAYYSDKGFFKDALGKTRKVNYITKDDGYDPARTIPLTDELLDSEKVFTLSNLGTAPSLKNYDKLNQRCIAEPFVQSGHPAFGDPVNHPWSIGMQLAYNTEAVFWGSFIDQHFAELSAGKSKVTVASLISNNDFGKAYDVGFKVYLAQSPNKDKISYVSETVEPTAPTVTDPMTTLAAKSPDVFIAMLFSSYCTQAVTAAAQNGMHDKAKYLFQPSVCPGNTYVKKEAVGSDGTASNGWWQVNPGTKEINDPAQFSDPFIAWARDMLTSKGIDPKSSSTLGSGIYYGWSWVQALITAGMLDGGLTRTNLALATHAMSITHPYHLPGIGFNVDGTKDSYYAEGGMFQRWDSAKQTWERQGNIIDLSGKSKNCPYDPSTGLCKG
ncbi:MAG: branched-chain amino acid transport system substrate-binding protein [Acidimicrobiia bacterium]|jgi:branched-chain amino acid transport system substrate-binding protein|nr:branched-chain amino acid transport system substrate-binding protein [Acidimicrobiia bacterium]